MGKKTIRLTEADIEKLVQKVLSEQTESVLVDKLNDKIESVMIEKQGDILNSFNVVIESKNNEDPYNNPMILTIANINVPINYYRLVNNLPTWFRKNIPSKKYTVGSVPLSTFYNDIWDGDEVLERFYNDNEYVKNQMDTLSVPLSLSVMSTNDIAVTQFRNRKKNRRGKRPYVRGNEMPLGDFFKTGGGKFGLNKNIMLAVEFGGLTIKLGEVYILPPQSPEGETINTDEFATEKIKLDLVDVFKFDTIDMIDPSGYQEILNKFKNDLSQGLKRMRGLKEFLQKQNLVVNGYASRDNDPNEQVQGKFTGCRGYGDGTRGQYNLCLSEERAKKVAEDLQEIFNSLGINVTIKSKGHGETSKFGSAWSKEKPTKPKDTQPNRRITFNIPKYTETTRN